MKQPPLPADPIGARFCQIFNHPWKFIIAPVPEPGERPAWKTESAYPLQPRNLWDTYCNSSHLLGLRFGKETRYALLDIDRGSRYHFLNNPRQFKSILEICEGIGLCRPLVIQSSDSGGIHVYFFLPEPIPTFKLACAIKFALLEAGVLCKPGEIESFPNVKAYAKNKPSNYNAHRLPLQVGSVLLDDDFEPLTNNLALFLDLADTAAACQDLTELVAAISKSCQRQSRTYTPSISNRAQEWKSHLENRSIQGWTGKSQTNELLKDFATYGVVWLALKGQALVEHVVATAINAPGYQQFCSHQHETRQRAIDWSRAAETYYSPYCSYPNRNNPYKQTFDPNAANNIVDFPNQANAQRHQQTQERIRQVVAYLEEKGTLPAAATARSTAIISASKALHGIGVSQTTLHKQTYLPLWHPKHHVKLGVITTPEPTSAISTQLEIEQIPAPPLEPKSLQTPLRQETKENYTQKSYMKVLGLPAAEDAPQAQSSVLNSESELNSLNPFQTTTDNNSKSELNSLNLFPTTTDNSKLSLNSSQTTTDNNSKSELNSLNLFPTTTDNSKLSLNSSQTTTDNNSKSSLNSGPVDFEHKQPLSLEAATAPRIETTDLERITKLRLQAICHAQKTVKREALITGRMIQGSERAHIGQIAKMQFYWQSGEPSLMSEAWEWAFANPGALPEALSPANSSSGNLAVEPPDVATKPNSTESAPHQLPTADSSERNSSSATALVGEPPTKPSPTTPPLDLLNPPSNRQLQPVEILTSAGKWLTGYFVHSCIAVANLIGIERMFTLFDADGQMYRFLGQIRPL